MCDFFLNSFKCFLMWALPCKTTPFLHSALSGAVCQLWAEMIVMVLQTNIALKILKFWGAFISVIACTFWDLSLIPLDSMKTTFSALWRISALPWHRTSCTVLVVLGTLFRTPLSFSWNMSPATVDPNSKRSQSYMYFKPTLTHLLLEILPKNAFWSYSSGFLVTVVL